MTYDRTLVRSILRAWAVVWVLGALAGAAVMARGQESKPLEITGGDPKIVKVDRVVVIKEDRQVFQSFPFFVHGTPDFALYFWTFPAELGTTDQGGKLRVNAAPNGTYTVSVKEIGADWAAKKFITQFRSVTFTVGDVKPEPIPPIPPDPKPVPPSPAPFPTTGLAALIVFESADLSKHPGLSDVMSGAKTNDYMAAKGIKGGFLKIDKDADVPGSNLDAWVKAAWQRPRASLPWLIISNGAAGYEGPIPKDASGVYSPALTVDLLRKFGG